MLNDFVAESCLLLFVTSKSLRFLHNTSCSLRNFTFNCTLYYNNTTAIAVIILQLWLGTIQTWFLIILGRSTYFWPLELAFWSGTLVKNWCSKIELHSRTDWQSQSYICMLLLSASQSCKENIRGGLFIFKYPAPLSTKNRQMVHSVWKYFENIKRNVDISNQKVAFFGFPPTVQPIKTPTNFLCLFWDMVTLV